MADEEELILVDEDLVLADEIGEGDEPEPCHIESCGQTGDVVIGEFGALEYCPGHAAQMALELLDLPLVKAALATQGRAVLVLDEAAVAQLNGLVKMVRSSAPAIVQSRDDWVKRLTKQVNAIYDARPGS